MMAADTKFDDDGRDHASAAGEITRCTRDMVPNTSESNIDSPKSQGA
jgi:hypothetical protein